MDRASHSLNPDDLLQHVSWVRALAVALVGENRADDLTQQTMLRAMERPPKHQSNLRGWLGAIARNFAFNASRRDSRRRELLEKKGLTKNPEAVAQAGDPGLPPTPEELLGRSEAHQQLISALKELPDPGRHLLLLRFFEDLEPIEIARRHGLPASTVRVQISRALKDLRKLMKARFGGDGMAPCVAILAPTLGSQLVPPVPTAAPVSSGFQPIAWAMGGIGLAAAAGVYLWGLSDAPSEGPLVEPPAAFAREKSESDFATAMVAGSEGASGIFSRQPVAAEALDLRLIDSQGGNLAGVRVRAHQEGQSLGFGITDANGHLRMPAHGGEVVLQISAAGRAPLLTRLALEPGERDIELPDGRPLQGRINARGAGGPVTGAAPRMLRLESDRPLYREGSPAFAWLDQIDPDYASYRNFLVPVDADGQFDFRGLPPDWSGFLASADPRWRLDDGGLDSVADGRLRLDRPRADLRVALDAVPRYHGRLVADQPLEQVVLTLRRGGVQSSHEVGPDGYFEILVDPAEALPLQLLVDAANGIHGDFRFDMPPRDGDLGALSLDTSLGLKLHIVDANGQPIPGALVLPNDPDAPGFHSDADGWVRLLAATGPSADPAADRGAFLVSAPGHRPRTVDGSEREVVLEAAPRLTFQLRGPGGTGLSGVEELTLRLRKEQGLFSGNSTLDRGFQPLIGALSSSGTHPQRGLFQVDLRPDPAGRIEVSGLSDGAGGTLEVLAPGGEILLERPLSRTAGTWTLDLPQTPRSWTVRVLDRAGRSIPDAELLLRARGSRERPLIAHSDLQGWVHVPQLYLERADLQVQAAGYLPLAKSDTSLASLAGQDLVLETARTVRVDVYDAQGTFLGQQRLGPLPEETSLTRLRIDGWDYSLEIGSGRERTELRLPARTTLLLPGTRLAAFLAERLADPAHAPRSGLSAPGSLWLKVRIGDQSEELPLLPGVGLAAPMRVPSGGGTATLLLRRPGAPELLLATSPLQLQPGVELELDFAEAQD